jgi:hypothetical protein
MDTGILEWSPTSATDSITGFFTDPRATGVQIDGPQKTYTSAPLQFPPGVYYFHVSAILSTCDDITIPCVDEFSIPPVLLNVPPDPPPAPPPPPPPPPDTVTSFSALKCASTQKAGDLVVQASMGENGTITVGGTLNVPNAAKVYKLKAVSVSATAGKTVTVKLKLTKQVLKAAKKALKRKKKVKASLTITARDAAGNTKIEKRAVKLKR